MRICFLLPLLFLSLACQPSLTERAPLTETKPRVSVSPTPTPQQAGLSFDRLLDRYEAAVSEHDEELWLSTIHPDCLAALSGDKAVVLERQMGTDFARQKPFEEWENLEVEEAKILSRNSKWNLKPTALARHRESIGGRVFVMEKMLGPSDSGGFLILIAEPDDEYVAESHKIVAERRERDAKAASIFEKIPFEAREHIAAFIYRKEKMAAIELLRVYVQCDSRTAKSTVEYIGKKSNSANTIDLDKSLRAITNDYRQDRADEILSTMSEKDKRDVIIAESKNDISQQLAKFHTDERVLAIVKESLR